MAFSSSSKTVRFAASGCGWFMAMAGGPVHAGTLDTAAAGAAPVALEHVDVLGSRVRGAAFDGPAPARVYDRDFIDATGALRLADFLNLLPENYTGAGSGRGSAPNDANPEFGVRTESSVPFYNFVLGVSDVPLGQSGVSGVNLRGLGSGSTLVLVDGRRRPIAGQGNRSTDTRQGFVDLNTIPLGMVERIEVLSDGASALYGSDAIGGAINVVLKKNYTGAELATNYRGTFDGGARERRATLTAGFAAPGGRLRGTIALDLYDRAPLRASQRDFSANQDHGATAIGRDETGAPVFGRDLRLVWGYPAVVQARSGFLASVVAPDGSPTSLALVPDGARATPPLSEFIGAPESDNGPYGLRMANSARFITLVAPQESRAVNASVEYDATAAVRLYAGASAAEVRAEFDGQPPVSATSSFTGFGLYSTVVPASIDGLPNAANPFGQDVMVGLVHEEFGPTRQTTRTRTRGAYAGATGRAGGDWTWDLGLSWQRENFAQRNLTLDAAAFSRSLAASDPARRFNPFVDAGAAGPVNAAVYREIAAVDAYDGTSELTTGTLFADGPLLSLPAGEVQLAAGGEVAAARHGGVKRSAAGVSSGTGAARDSYAAFAEISVPLVGRSNARPGIRRLTLQLAGRGETAGDAGSSFDPKLAAVWAPAAWWQVRAGYATGFRAPSLTEYETAPTTFTYTITDPRRTPANTPGVPVRFGSNPAAKPETSRSEFIAVTLAPAAVPEFSATAEFHRVRQRDLLQTISYSGIVANEAVLPGRVTRTAPTAQDLALGQPGAIVAVDASFVNLGRSEIETLDLAVDWARRFSGGGRLRLHLGGTRLLAQRNELRPGTTIDLAGDTAAPQRWRWIGTLVWNRGSWSGAVFADYVGGFTSNEAGNLSAPQGSPAMTVVSVNAGYTFARGIGRGWARNAKVGVGIGNLFDRAPPFSDTIFGYNGGLHSPLGRSYVLSLTMPF